MAVQRRALKIDSMDVLTGEDHRYPTVTAAGLSPLNWKGGSPEKRSAVQANVHIVLPLDKRRCVKKYKRTSTLRAGAKGLKSVDIIVEESSCSKGGLVNIVAVVRRFMKATRDAIEERSSWQQVLTLFSDTRTAMSPYFLTVALYEAIIHRCGKGVEVLLSDSRTDPSKDEYKALRDCIQTGFAEGLMLLLDDVRVDPTQANFCLFEEAIENCQVKVVQVLLQDSRLDPSLGNNACLRLAALRGSVEIMELLLQNECVDPGDNDNEALRIASKRGDVNMVKALVRSSKVDPSAKKNEAMRCAAQDGHEETVRELLLHPKVDPTARKFEALRSAAKANHKAIVDLIVCDCRVRGKLDEKIMKSLNLNASQRDKMTKIKRVSEELRSDSDPDFYDRYRSHILKTVLVGSVEELFVGPHEDQVSDRSQDAETERKRCDYKCDSCYSGWKRNAEESENRTLRKVFRRNVEEYLPKPAQAILNNVTPSLQLYNKVFKNSSKAERLQFLFEWKFNFRGETDSNLLKAGFRPSAQQIPDVKSFPELFLYVKNTSMEFAGKQIGKLFSERTCGTTKPSLSHCECIGLFRVIMYAFSQGPQKLKREKDAQHKVLKLIVSSIKYKMVHSSKVALADRLALLEAKAFNLAYEDIMKELTAER